MPMFISRWDFKRLEAKVDALLTDAGISLKNEAFIINQEHAEMAAIDDLNAAVTKTAAAIQTAITELNTAHGNDDDAGVESAAQKLSDLADALAAAPAQVAAANPAPTTT